MAIQKTRGIDISYYQGVIDWAAVKAAGVEWCIIRGGFGVSNVDTQFVNNITGAIAAGFERIGIYWFSYAHNADTARAEVEFCNNTISAYRDHITMPVFWDWEGASYSYVQSAQGISLTGAQIRDIGTAWCNAMQSKGYSTGVYSNKSNGDDWFKLPSGLYLWQSLGVDFWYARYGANNETSLFVDPAFEATALSEHPETKIFQFSDVGRVSGINSNRVDLNIMYESTPDPPTPPEPPTPVPVPAVKPHSDDIEYLEIRNTSFGLIGIMDTAQSIIWHSVYYGVGDFEIYVRATSDAVNMLQVGYYVFRPNDIEVGIIESVNIIENMQDGKMIVATGRFAKSILDRRLICSLTTAADGKIINNPTTLYGNVETEIREVITDNAINCTDTRRNISVLELGAVAGLAARIVDADGNAATKQTSYENLLSYTDSVLQEYEIASMAVFNDSSGKLQYICYAGTDRSVDNSAGLEPIVFSREFDNLTASEYLYSEQEEKNTALIGGQGEGIERFYSLINSGNGLDRREVFVDCSSISKTYKDGETDKTYTSAEYKKMLDTKGKQTLSTMKTVESFTGTIDITNGNYIYNRDFSIGDIVTIQDNDIGKYINVRILEVTESQDEHGYKISAKYEN